MALCDEIQNALNYIEENLTEKLDADVIASKACMSNYYFQKIFGVLCGMTLGEYIRNRRLAEAGNELCAAHTKVIDAAIKYGYDSPDSFTKAFTKFHGITPSAAKKEGGLLKAFAPLHIKLTLEGGTVMDYKIEEMTELKIIGMKRVIRYDEAYTTVPIFWNEYCKNGLFDKVCGCLGINVADKDNKESFDYYIGDLYDGKSEIPDGFEIFTIPAYNWIKFRCVGKMPKALQDVNTRIWSEWLPNNKEFELADTINIEMYTEGDTQSDDYESGIWLPIKRK